MKEIGGFFELDWFVSNHYYDNLIELNTARHALIYLVKAKGIKKIFIPQFICDSVSGILLKNSVDYECYKIDENFNPIFNKKLNKNEYLYIVNYYGQISKNRVKFLREKHGKIILDNVQAFFQEPILDIDTIYSCRKFFGVPDGAYLATDTLLEEDLKIDISMNRMTHLLGRFERSASEYHDIFKANDLSFKNEGLKRMSKLTKNILGAIDYNRIKNTRNSNFEFLYENFQDSNLLSLNIPEGPFCYPYYVENGIEIRKKLVEHDIYIPTLWPNVLDEVDKNSVEYKYVNNILPLPCDQRYDLNDMIRLVECVKGEIYGK